MLKSSPHSKKHYLRGKVLCDGDDVAQLLTTGKVNVDSVYYCVTSVHCLPEIPS